MKKLLFKKIELFISVTLVFTLIFTNANFLVVTALEVTTDKTSSVSIDEEKTIENNGEETSEQTENLIPSYTEITELSPLYSNAISDLNNISSNSLKQSVKAINNKNLKVAFVGDSITEGADLHPLSHSYVSKFDLALKEALPDVNIDTQNYSLGARGISQLASANYLAVAEETNFVLNFSRPWSIPGKAWRDHPKDFSPDMLVIAVGMNDAHNRSNSDIDFWKSLDDFCSYTKTWPKIPDIILVPTILPTKNSSIYDQRQDITNTIATVTREYAKEKGYICADANRLFQILRDGQDVLSTTSKVEKDISKVEKFTNGTIDLNLSFNSYDLSGGIDLIYRSSDLGSVILKLLANSNGTGTASLYFSDTQSTQKIIEPDKKLIYDTDEYGNSIVIFKDNEIVELTPALTVNIPSLSLNSEHKIRIQAEGIYHKLYINNSLILEYKSYEEVMGGKILANPTGHNNPTISNQSIEYKVPKVESPLYSEKELLGEYNNPNENGNGTNHPNELGHSLAYFPSFSIIVEKLKSSYHN